MTTHSTRQGPTFTQSEASRYRLADKETYVTTLPLWQLGVAQGCGQGIEPTHVVTNKLVARYQPAVLKQLEADARRQIDPVLAKIDDRCHTITANGQELEQRDPKLTSPETGIQYSEAEAVDQVHALDAKIAADEDHGLRHHRRVARWLRWIGKFIPYVEAIGMILFAASALNVDFFDPLENPLGWSVAVVIVGVVLFAQPRFVEKSATAFNHRREAIADHQSAAAEAATKSMTVNIVLTAVFASFVTGGLVERFLAVNFTTDPIVITLMVGLCLLAGIGMPLLAWYSIAFDGSRHSRERDHLAAELDRGLEVDTGLRAGAALLYEQNQADAVTLAEHTVPSILRSTDLILDKARSAYAFLRIQLGGLPDNPPYTNPNLPTRNPWILDTGIPGASTINGTPIADRSKRLTALLASQREAMQRINSLPPHPWHP